MRGSEFGRISLLICCLGAAVLVAVMPGLLRSAGALEVEKETTLNEFVQVTSTLTDCPHATEEPPPMVEPLISPTNLFTQTITVYHRSEAITVTSESGVFAVTEGDEDWGPMIDIRLLRNWMHHLTVISRVPEYSIGDCYYGGYTMRTTSDRNGNPLIIEQVSPTMEYRFFLPVFIRTGSLQE